MGSDIIELLMLNDGRKTYPAGMLIAVMPGSGMTSETTHCSNFSRVGKSTQISLTAGQYLVVGIGSSVTTVKATVSLSSFVIVLGDKS